MSTESAWTSDHCYPVSVEATSLPLTRIWIQRSAQAAIQDQSTWRRLYFFSPSVLAFLSCFGQVDSWNFLLFESSVSWVEMFVPKLALLRLCLVVSVMETAAPTSAPTRAPTSSQRWLQGLRKKPLARTSPTCRPHRRIKWIYEWVHDEVSLESDDDCVDSYVTVSAGRIWRLASARFQSPGHPLEPTVPKARRRGADMLGVSVELIGRVKHVGSFSVHHSLMHSYCWAAGRRSLVQVYRGEVCGTSPPSFVCLSLQDTVFAMEAENVKFAVLHPLSRW